MSLADETMSVGVASLDAEHQQVRRRLRQVAASAGAGRADEVRAALRHLHADLGGRHADEERWISQAGYPGEREHARAHRALLERIAAARDGDARALFQAAREAVDAVEAHLRFDDLKLGRFWTARQNLRKLAERGPGGGVLLTPIPGTPTPSPVGALTPVPPRRTPAPAPSAERAAASLTPAPVRGPSGTPPAPLPAPRPAPADPSAAAHGTPVPDPRRGR